MFCSSCGKQLPENSQFCQYCGSSIAGDSGKIATLSSVLTSPTREKSWEYKEVSYTIADYLTKGDPNNSTNFLRHLNNTTVNAVLFEIWNSIELKLANLTDKEVKSGWEIDPLTWGPSVIEYSLRTSTTKDWSCAAWAVYVFLGTATSGLGFIITPFLMKWEILQVTDFKVRFRKFI